MTDSEYVLTLIDETFATVPEVKAHHDRMRLIAGKLSALEVMANGLTQAETEATPSCSGLTVKPWTTWEGGTCPVDRNATVEIRYDGDPLGEIDKAGSYRWTWNDGGTRGDIVAYRVL